MPTSLTSPRGQISKKQFKSQDQTMTGNTTGMVFNSKLAFGNAAQTNYLNENTTGNITLPVGLALSAQTGFLTQTATYTKLPTGLALSAQTTFFTANATCPLIFPVLTAIPTKRAVGGICFVSNSTGRRLAFHSTGTTWKYLAGVGTLA